MESEYVEVKEMKFTIEKTVINATSTKIKKELYVGCDGFTYVRDLNEKT